MPTCLSKSQEYTSGSGNWSVPANVSSVFVTMIGAGGSGAGTSSIHQSASGGGSGEYCFGVEVKVPPGGTVAYSVGTGGLGVSGAQGNDGGDTTFGPLKCSGGHCCNFSFNEFVGGNGGGPNYVISGAGAAGNPGKTCGRFTSGSGGGGESTGGGPGKGGDSLINGFVGGIARNGAAGGGASPWGNGADGPSAVNQNGTDAAANAYGTGGSGASTWTTNHRGGNGAGGYILIQWAE